MLEEFIETLKVISPPLVNQSELKKIFDSIFGIENGSLLYKHIFSVSTLLRDRSIHVDEFFKSLNINIKKRKWSDKEFEKFESFSRNLKVILQLDIICFTTKILAFNP